MTYKYQKATSFVTITPRTIRYVITTLTNKFITNFRKALLLLSQISKKAFYLRSKIVHRDHLVACMHIMTVNRNKEELQ